MPIFVKDYTWHETRSNIQLDIPLKGSSPKNVSLCSTDDYIKVSYPPYILEVFLLHDVLDKKSRTIISDGIIKVILEKKVQELWHSLCKTNLTKSEMVEKKAKVEKEIQERILQQENSKNELKAKQKSFSIHQQIELEASKKERIKQEKEKEKREVDENIKKWKTTLDEEKDYPLIKRNIKPILVIPPPRKAGFIDVTFTERVFPTAARESQAEEEQEWLRKQAKARQTLQMAYDNKDLKPEERDPVWLKEKGDGFYKSGNYLAALNAYSHAIYFDCKLASVFSNRAACHLKMGNFHKAVGDSSKALELLTPAVPSNAKSRMKAHIRRGTAFCGLELFVEGLEDYEAALKIEPYNEILIQDIKRIRHIIQNTTET